jgi:hypothetical protein
LQGHAVNQRDQSDIHYGIVHKVVLGWAIASTQCGCYKLYT